MKAIFQIILSSFRAAMVSLIPYLFFRSAWIIFIVVNNNYSLVPYEDIATIDILLGKIFPVLLTCTLAYHLSFHFFDERLLVTSLAITMFLVFSGYITKTDGGLVISDAFVLDDAILIPVLVCLGYFLVNRYMKYKLIRTRVVNPILEGAINGMMPHLLVFLVIGAVYFLLEQTSIHSVIEMIAGWPVWIQAYFHTLIIHVIWLTGVHGAAAYYTFFDSSFVSEIYVSNMSFSMFFDVFVIYGGAGSTWALIIAIMLFSNMKFARTLAKISIPFAIINVNELLVFGLPIIFNPILAIPFVLVPMVNHLFAQVYLSLVDVIVIRESIEWVTPSLLDSYLVTGGNVKAILLQVLIISLDVMLYMPFVRKYSNTSNDSLLNTLIRKLRFSYAVPVQKEVSFLGMHNELVEQQDKLNKSLKDILAGELRIYYQPQFESKTLQMIGVESLLRLESDQSLNSPDFIRHFENAKIGEYIDKWVVDTVESDVKTQPVFRNFALKVSLNLNVDSLGDKQFIKDLINKMSGYPVCFEITETIYSQNVELVSESVRMLREAGFLVAIDDFGTGYSSLSMLSALDADVIKLDRLFLKQANTVKGKELYRSMISTLKRLGFVVVSEGIETEEELEFVQSCNADVLQGYYFSRAINVDELEQYFNDEEALGHAPQQHFTITS
ncbi:putative Phosphotransferase system cellobiose-specific component IIC fused with EAL domain [Vibrio nigripulchritudo MADA3029]|uniref:Phosphotransferase system cellobiose-specific component IIC fused with EAL domain n=1 Tax=Vibrio nigripulchritudo SOn1 TaxID=1238450 RepID=A0AAV2VIT2_9VIBR|nr:EAL domain-containing protein [Vibrio nigripulchritudo]EGU53589.1 putative diguanylate phosphodiesterase [Vibrio nigripulchritudo ATCC 27043]CCN36791.1 putative Phosphotransferase system cellobiose-specific component IIC fused with EAL domain [Vibrio nigripulchritudo AM115]CCN44567.1 putative Phosphotransferase system cellobiose-specific component IIC fused with EAL domain [Vibrio nigripulchritudo FTn2]CCN45755.1 putative Phosphotransferase system cellobiose-specific component IIC fused with